MAPINVSDTVAKILKEEGVDWWAGIHGGHVWQLIMSTSRAGVRMYHMRHEQCGAYMADGYARVTKKPAVCFGTAGPGFTNMVSGIVMAYLAKSPIICILGQHGTAEDGWGPFQEAYAEPTCGKFTKWIKRLVDPTMAAYTLQRAFRDATAYPCGPVVIEIPTNLLGEVVGEENAMRGYLPKGRCAPPAPPAGDPAMVEKAVRMLLAAKNPIVIGGDGIYWSDASKELLEFVELLNVILCRKVHFFQSL